MPLTHLFVAGVPATGKTWFGEWLAKKHGYFHIDAERDYGVDFDKLGVHAEWDDLIGSHNAREFVAAINKQPRPVVVNWGFPTRFLYVAAALKAEAVPIWWFNGDPEMARRAFVRRGGIDPALFDKQMSAIERDWAQIEAVFRPRILHALRQDGSHRTPEELWSEVSAGG
jgi:hypothetical protein